MTLADKFNLEKQVTFYLSYHANPINVAIHLVCIWPLLITGLALGSCAPPFADNAFLSPYGLAEYVTFDIGFVAMVVYVLWYVALDPIAGSGASVAIVLLHAMTTAYTTTHVAMHGETPWRILGSLHLGAWILQFIGHGVFERRAPALFESLDQALITAPLFVVLELLLPLGYRREMHERVQRQVQRNLDAFHKRA
ncbi:hypothetical protein SPRG_00120 [Saprolegnia parasitica CBS 223.65]|uniref:DUF962 domain-containing protein n=1 Tax=Saprolegnia parasitica (strain CBS 223.65) TaxID=695850 RepID=A0A067CXR4_SAPPC|nr:hypothetical protein SPRG_00120 [Saprolegnia parasitica CBS 223.65]KDO35273.1 hypothetical protein SPRG_00120 [Saprolegnia parasitica CBS 223.65]|eukprot:XP_012193623.1 hypothetical protein SPRG_00120 [Saprolegnia parasitica CBS 223.65]